ncbi:hypothetical protein A3710_01180 [Stutzerimonas frequens]|nr:hypothetical protein A3710_01180 [Stutzerimonas frequens]
MQQSPAPRQGQCFAVVVQMLAQSLGDGAPALVAQGEYASLAQRHQRAEIGPLVLDDAQASLADVGVLGQGAFQHR